MSRTSIQFSYPLVCPCCKGSLVEKNSGIQCRGCSTSFPMLRGVPLLIKNAEWRHLRSIDRALAGKLLRLLDLPSDEQNTRAAQAILGGKLFHPSLRLTTESSQFVARVKSSLPNVWPGELDALISTNPVPRAQRGGSEQVELTWDSPFFPKEVASDSLVSVNFRIKNVGSLAISSEGDDPIVASGHWISEYGEREVMRTRLLIDVLPDSELTFPLMFKTPPKAGKYRFRPSLLIEGKRWFIGSSEFETDVVEELSTTDVFTRCPSKASYSDDHITAIALLRDWCQALPSDVVVELGGNFSPSLSTIFKEVVCIDVDFSALQFAALKKNHMVNICADGFALPFADCSINVFAMFATLHHFPNPDELLRHIRTKIKRDGVLALMCEPVGHVFRESMPDVYRLELEKGVNEQSFSEAEWLMIFEKSGFRAERLVLHGSSLKALLRPVTL